VVLGTGGGIREPHEMRNYINYSKGSLHQFEMKKILKIKFIEGFQFGSREEPS
jgi:hypothetical protein